MSREDIFLRESAWRFILEQNITSLPVSSYAIAKKNDYKLITYAQFAVNIDKPVEYLVEQYDNDGFVFWSKTEDCFIICYNEALSAPVIRWTVFISVSDAFDSLEHESDADGLEVAFKLLVHEQYSRDLSHKIKTAKRTRALRGEVVTKNCAFGFKKVGNRLIIEDAVIIEPTLENL